jgi:hypothetical protein
MEYERAKRWHKSTSYQACSLDLSGRVVNVVKVHALHTMVTDKAEWLSGCRGVRSRHREEDERSGSSRHLLAVLVLSINEILGMEKYRRRGDGT